MTEDGLEIPPAREAGDTLKITVTTTPRVPRWDLQSSNCGDTTVDAGVLLVTVIFKYHRFTCRVGLLSVPVIKQCNNLPRICRLW